MGKTRQFHRASRQSSIPEEKTCKIITRFIDRDNMLPYQVLLICSQVLASNILRDSNLPKLEKEFSADTDSCVEAARLKHKNNPNAGLDHFLNCLLNHVNVLQETKDNDEIDELKSTLEEIENIPMFSQDGFNHNLVRREASEEDIKDTKDLEKESGRTYKEYDQEESLDQEALEDLSEEGRGGKKNGEKKKNKDKRNKKHKNKKKYKLKESDESYKQVETESTSESTTEALREQEEEVDPYTNGIQFSVYSGDPQPEYRPQPQDNSNKFLYSMD